MRTQPLTRRAFVRRAAQGSALSALALSGMVQADDASRSASGIPPVAAFQGSARERGRQYGSSRHDSIAAFLDKEIYRAFAEKPSSKDEMLRYAAGCAEAARKFSPEIHEEFEGMAEGSGIRLEELILITLHEELYHRRPLPHSGHCTAVAIGPPRTGDAGTFVGQTWDWMQTVVGLSSMVHWKRASGPSVLAYGFPGMWCGAGMNAAGLALCWTSAGFDANQSPRIGVPSYVLLTHFLYQDSLNAVAEEARRANQAGWFTFVMADATGRLMNIEGAPGEISVEETRGSLVRVGYGSRQMTRVAENGTVKYHPRCQKMYDLIQNGGSTGGDFLRATFSDPDRGICAGKGTIDMMVFDVTRRIAMLSRGPEYGIDWQITKM